MDASRRRAIGACLILSAALLGSLVPGGPVEHRDFSHIAIGTLGAFNAFLTALALGSLALPYLAYRNHPWTARLAFAVGLAYALVYAVDLAQLFPRSPTPMSRALASIEVLGMIVAALLMHLSWGGWRARRDGGSRQDLGDGGPEDRTRDAWRRRARRGPRAILASVVVALALAGTLVARHATEAAATSPHAVGPAAVDAGRVP